MEEKCRNIFCYNLDTAECCAEEYAECRNRDDWEEILGLIEEGATAVTIRKRILFKMQEDNIHIMPNSKHLCDLLSDGSDPRD